MICPIWAGVSVPVGSYTNTAYENGGMPIPLITWKYHSGFSRTDALIETGGSKFAANSISAAAVAAAGPRPLGGGFLGLSRTICGIEFLVLADLRLRARARVVDRGPAGDGCRDIGQRPVVDGRRLPDDLRLEQCHA